MKWFFFLLIPLAAVAGVHSDNPWSKREVKTCFGGNGPERPDSEDYKLEIRAWSRGDKAKIKQWVTEEYSEERTGIHFTGFGDCKDSPDADVVIFYNKNSRIATYLLGGLHGLSTIGPHFGSVSGHPKAEGFISISKSGMDKGTVVHEFGHSAGLEHELLHPEAYENEKGKCDLAVFTVPRNGLEYTEYDKDSVMNYCKLHGKGGSRLGLSPLDVELLKILYH